MLLAAVVLLAGVVLLFAQVEALRTGKAFLTAWYRPSRSEDSLAYWITLAFNLALVMLCLWGGTMLALGRLGLR